MPLIADFWRHSDFKSLCSKSPMCFSVVIVVDFLTKVRLSDVGIGGKLKIRNKSQETRFKSGKSNIIKFLKV